MEIKYLYIEDKQEKNVKFYIRALESLKNIKIEHYQLKKDDIAISIIKEKNKYVDGILIDFRLDEGGNYPFNAPSIIQEFRQQVSDNNREFIDMPVVLISTDDKIKHLYEKETTSHDLFDSYILKGELVENDFYQKKKIIELISLAKGYKKIRSIKEKYIGEKVKDEIIRELLDIGEKQNYIDTNIFGKLINKPFSPEHEYANFIIKNLLRYNGYLIDEFTLAARLGICIEGLNNNEKEEWEKIKEFFKDAKYTGVFSDGWQRWWMSKVNEIFEEISDGIYLIELNAEKRVEILKKKLSLIHIRPAEPIKCNNSTEYWVVCKRLRKPLDTLEGFKAATEKELYSWQEPEYYSFYALVNEIFTDEESLKEHLHPDEWDRFFEMLEERKKECK